MSTPKQLPTTLTTGVLATPDPWMTYEQYAALAVTIISNVVILFKLNVSDARQEALMALVNSVYVAFVLVHAAVVRNGRSRSLSPVTPVEAATGPQPTPRGTVG